MIRVTLCVLLLGAPCGNKLGAALAAEQADSMEAGVLVEVIKAPSAKVPSGTLGTPTAFPLRPGRLAIGFLLQPETRAAAVADGVVSLTVGVGGRGADSGDVTLNILSVGVHEPIAKRTSLSAKLARRLSERSAVAVGVRNGLVFGGSDTPSQAYLVYTVTLRSGNGSSLREFRTTVGLGYLWTSGVHGRYRDTAEEVASRYGPMVVLASVATTITSSSTAFLEWTGQDMNMGVVLPVGRSGLSVAAVLADLTHRAPRGPRLVFAFGMPFGM